MPKASDPVSQFHLRSVALSTVCSFAGWAEFEVLLVEQCKLLKLLYTLLDDETLKTQSCECLLHILARKVS